MSQKIDPREVLVYLNELGYTNITAQQLKEFIIDLKKLLKYDSRFGGFSEGASKEQHYGQEESEYCECESYEGENETNNYNKENQTQAVQKEVTNIPKDEQKGKHIAVHIYNTKSGKKVLHDHCVHINKLGLTDTDADPNKLKLTCNNVTSGPSKGEIETESTVRSIRPSSTRESQSRASSKERKSKVTFIRPATARPSFNKSDPVALYHYYRSEWKKTKIPGQDNRDDLRWAIRERMLSGPKASRGKIKVYCPKMWLEIAQTTFLGLFKESLIKLTIAPSKHIGYLLHMQQILKVSKMYRL